MRSKSLILAVLLAVAAAAILPAQDVDALNQALKAGRDKFVSFDFPGSIGILNGVVTPLMTKRQTTVLSADERTVLTQALELRGLAFFNTADEASARADFDSLLSIEPKYALSPDYSSAQIQEFFNDVRKKIIGTLTVMTDPVGAVLTIDGRPAGTSNIENFPIREGAYKLHAELPGYAAADADITITAGKLTESNLTLERTQAALTLRTSPTGVEVYLDGTLVGTTSGTAGADFAESAQELGLPLDAISAEFRIPMVDLGHHVLEFRRDCYEYVRAPLQEITSANDYNLPTPFTLKESVGSVKLTGVPASARVLLNGEERGKGESSFEHLCAGNYRIEVIASSGRFSSTVDLKANDALTIPVTLNPALVLLKSTFSTVLDESERDQAGRTISDLFTGTSVFETIKPGDDFYGRIPAEIRTAYDSLTSLKPQGEFGKLSSEQQAAVRYVCREFSAGSAAIAVFHDHKLGIRLRILFFSAEIPYFESTLVNIDDPKDVQRVRSLLHSNVEFSRSWLGITAVDTRIHKGAVVIAVQAGSPAAAGNLEAGMTIAGIDGKPVNSYRDLIEGLKAKNPGDSVSLDIVKANAPSSAQITLGSSPQLLSLDNAPILYIPVIASMQLIAEAPDGGNRSNLALFNIGIAMGHFGAWEDAIRYLRRVQLGSDPGVNQGTVSYFIGLGFENLGYKAEAIEQYQKALTFENATLDHNDGPPLAPQARQRLNRLQATQ